MDREDFERLRKAPSGREGVFVFEAQLVRERKQSIATRRVNLRPVGDAFREVAPKILPEIAKERVDVMFEISSNLRHVQDLDPAILVVASFLFLSRKGGVNFNPVEDIVEEGVIDVRTMDNQVINQAVQAILGYNEITHRQDLVPQIKADILAYYIMFLEN